MHASKAGSRSAVVSIALVKLILQQGEARESRFCASHLRRIYTSSDTHAMQLPVLTHA